MSLQDLQPYLLALSPAEKAQAIELLIISLSNVWSGIDKTPEICGGDARIANSRIPVWVLVQARTLGNSDAQILANYPSLSATDLSNAWRYADAHPDEIDLAISENMAA